MFCTVQWFISRGLNFTNLMKNFQFEKLKPFKDRVGSISRCVMTSRDVHGFSHSWNKFTKNWAHLQNWIPLNTLYIHYVVHVYIVGEFVLQCSFIMNVFLITACDCPNELDLCDMTSGQCSSCPELVVGRTCNSCLPNSFGDPSTGCEVCFGYS